ncbi:MAG: iron-sulfur cluster assembly scaffold protein [Sphingomicrobium sp.]
MSEPLYTRDILRLASEIPHLGLLAEPHGSADLRSPACGSRVEVTVCIDDAGRVIDLGQSVSACAFGQASAALMGATAIGRSHDDVEGTLAELTDWLSGATDHPGSWPGLSALAPARGKTGRHGAILLPFRALLAAIEDAIARR